MNQNQKQELRFNRHQVRGKLCGAYVFIGKNTPLWSAVYASDTAGVEWSVATFRGTKRGDPNNPESWGHEIFLRPFKQGIGWKAVKLQVVKSGAFRLYVSLDACPPLSDLPKKFSVEGTTVLRGGMIAWTGILPEVEVPA